MIVFRVFWLLVAGVAVALTMWAGTWPAQLCGPIPGPGDLPEECSISTARVLGVWPLIGLGTVLSAPAVLSAAVMRTWIPVLAVVAYGGMSVAGLVNWWNHWAMLLCAVPLMLLAILFGVLQLLVATDDETGPANA